MYNLNILLYKCVCLFQVELLINEYPKGVADLHFHHKGCDTQFWAGHYGSKMSGACVKILWDSIAN